MTDLRPPQAAAVLFGLAVLLLLVAGLTGRGDVTTAALILCGTASFFAGVFLLTFSREEPPDPRLTAMLPVQGAIDIARLAADLGLRGVAHMVPDATRRVVQVIPVADTLPAPGEGSIVLDPEAPGIALPPLGLPLLAMLEDSAGLVVPADVDGAGVAFREALTLVLCAADQVTVREAGESLEFSITGFRLADTCTAVRRESPAVCRICPCPVCSLALCLATVATGRTWRADRIDADPKKRSVTLVITPAE
ncbi:MAG: hypothetical protein ACP5C4_05880 [Methanomicrobiales archaeon]